ncbi:MAG: hypothetical protein ACRDHP_09235 [Ktedonobacterales bacterium]
MYYQVVARSCIPSGAWEYYPYWAPVRDKDAATRLASYAAQTGYEAAILQSVTAEMLQNIARGVVDRQDMHLLPALRYLPGARVATASGHREHGVETEFHLSETLDPYLDGPDKVELDGRRLTLEMGSVGDVMNRAGWQPQHISLPRRMDVLQIWMSLHRRLLRGEIGGLMDGAPSESPED